MIACIKFKAIYIRYSQIQVVLKAASANISIIVDGIMAVIVLKLVRMFPISINDGKTLENICISVSFHAFLKGKMLLNLKLSNKKLFMHQSFALTTTPHQLMTNLFYSHFKVWFTFFQTAFESSCRNGVHLVSTNVSNEIAFKGPFASIICYDTKSAALYKTVMTAAKHKNTT